METMGPHRSVQVPVLATRQVCQDHASVGLLVPLLAPGFVALPDALPEVERVLVIAVMVGRGQSPPGSSHK